MRPFSVYLLLLSFFCLNSQNLYFPPTTGDTWETMNYEELNWCEDKVQDLIDFQRNAGTKAFIILKDGKIVIEEYLNGFESTDAHQWNSAGKTITSFLIGKAQEEGLLDIEDKTSDYLGAGWTSLTSEQEEKITIKHQLTMTSGLDESVDAYCTDPECLQYKAEPDERWSYHNSPYTLLGEVIKSASGRNYNTFTSQQLGNKIGMTGLWVPIDYNVVYFSKARSMARFGLLMLNRGDWDGEIIMSDKSYYDEMINTSQDLNKSYGYLWWLNGKGSYMLPGLQLQIRTDMTPEAPADMYSAIGKNGQYLNVVPSQNLVIVRMGDAPDSRLVPLTFHNEMWEKINDLECTPSNTEEVKNQIPSFFPNPFSDKIDFEKTYFKISVFNQIGQLIYQISDSNQLNTSTLEKGQYHFLLENEEGENQWKRGVKE